MQVDEHHAIVSALLTQFERYFVETGQHQSYDVRNSVGHLGKTQQSLGGDEVVSKKVAKGAADDGCVHLSTTDE